MKRVHLFTTVAASLLLVAGSAAAQGTQDQGTQAAPGRAPAAQQKAPAEKIAPPMHAGKHLSTNGQAAKGDRAAGMEKGERGGTTGQATQDKPSGHTRSEERGKKPDATTGQATHDERGAQQSGAEHREKSGDQGAMSHERPKNEQRSGENRSNATSGQGAAGSQAKLSTEQRSKITTIIKQKKVEPVHLNISVRVGARVPASVHFYPLPAEVVTIYPEWRGYDYILVGDQILVVEPDTHEIVAILEA